MKKIVVLFLIAAVIFYATGCTNTDSSNGVYLPVRVEKYYYSDDYPTGEKRVTINYKYDKNNHLEHLEYQNAFGKYIFAATCDKYGRVLECGGSLQVSNDLLDMVKKTYTYSPSGKLQSTRNNSTTYDQAYNSKGLVASVIRTREHWTQDFVVLMDYTYTSENQLESIRSYRINNDQKTLYATTCYEYNSGGKLTTEKCYDANGSIVRDVTYTYKGNKTYADMTRYSETGTDHVYFIFDHVGNLIERRYESFTETFVYTYKRVTIAKLTQENIFVYHLKLTATGITEWYDLRNV